MSITLTAGTIVALIILGIAAICVIINVSILSAKWVKEKIRDMRIKKGHPIVFIDTKKMITPELRNDLNNGTYETMSMEEFEHISDEKPYILGYYNESTGKLEDLEVINTSCVESNVDNVFKEKGDNGILIFNGAEQ